jgi:predicted aspartyl protease
VAEQETIKMAKDGGVYVVPVLINKSITLNAAIDSGASGVSVPGDIVLILMHSNAVSQGDFLGQQTDVLTDGSSLPSRRLLIRSLKVGNKIIEDVVADIAPGNAEILLGQGFLTKFKAWSVDNEKHILILK